MTRKKRRTVVLLCVTILIFAVIDFWHGYHQSRSIPLGVITAVGGFLGATWAWPGPTDDRPDGQDSSGTLI
jgi:hypothetical protein